MPWYPVVRTRSAEYGHRPLLPPYVSLIAPPFIGAIRPCVRRLLARYRRRG